MDTISTAIEIGVGLASLLAAAGVYGRPGRRWLTGLLAIAGAVAVVHGVLAIVR